MFQYQRKERNSAFFRGGVCTCLISCIFLFVGCSKVDSIGSYADDVNVNDSNSVTLNSFQLRGLISHRGYAVENPENTMSAFRASVEHGYKAIETDINISKDGVPVCMHDITLERTTDGTGELTEYTLEELKELDAGSYYGMQFEGEEIPTLEEFLLLCKENNTYAELDLVREPIFYADNLQKVYEVVKKTDMIDKTIFTISSVQLSDLVSLDTHLNICYASLINENEMKEALKYIELCDTMIASIPYGYYTEDFASKLHDNHFMIKVWTVDDVELVQSYFDDGVEMVITNSILPDDVS